MVTAAEVEILDAGSAPIAWMTGRAVVSRAVEMIGEGALDGGLERELASECGVSSRHLRRLFSEVLGVTPSQLARSIRAQRALRMLRNTDLTVAEIAFRSGFGSVRALNRACRDMFEATPLALRNEPGREDV